MNFRVQLDDLPTLRGLTLGSERVYHLENTKAYRTLCERFFEAGFDFPQCLSGVDMQYGLRVVLHLRRLRDHAEVTLWVDVPYDKPNVPTVSDLWRGVDWHEREAYDLLGVRFEGHSDLRRILLEDHWTIHPLQRRYDTGGYLIPEWEPQPWPDFAAQDREREAERKLEEAERVEAEGAAVPATGPALTEIRALNANYAAKLQEQGISSVEALAGLDDERLEPLATALGLKSPVAVQRWHDGARELLAAPAKESTENEAEDETKGNGDLSRIKTLNANYAARLRKVGISTLEALAGLTDEGLEPLASRLGLKSRVPLERWREGAREVLGASAEEGKGSEEKGGGDLSDIRTLNATFAAKLKEQGVTSVEALATLGDESLEGLAAAMGLKKSTPIVKWREGARALRGEAAREDAPPEEPAAPEPPRRDEPQQEASPPEPDVSAKSDSGGAESVDDVQDADSRAVGAEETRADGPDASREDPKAPVQETTPPVETETQCVSKPADTADLETEPDDFTRIKGVGPAYAKRLRNAGVTTFKGLAELSDDEVARIGSKMSFKGRIQRDEWREQARAILEERS